LEKTKTLRAKRLLDVGCGAGKFCLMASEAGFNVSGFDASENLIEIARERMPGADFKTGDMEELPYPDSTFDAVTGINSFQFADNIPKALKEAGRVAKKGGSVIIAVWGKPEECDASAMFSALAPYMPPPPHKKEPGKKPLFSEGALEDLARQAGLYPESSEEIKCTWNFENKQTALKGMISAGLIELAIRNAGIEKITDTISDSIKQFQTKDGGYVLKNTFRFLTTTA
jgi:ubiquinone/menaquinone biosynthesis C-methylase UbiE